MATTLASIIGQARTQLQDLGALDTPALPTITPTGTAGATAYSYKVVALAQNGTSAASAAGSTATGNATLSSTNFNRVTWLTISGAAAYAVYRTVGGVTQGLIATVGGTLTLDDTGLVGDASTAPSTAAGTSFWSAQELLDIAIDGCRDMWRAMIDLHQEHFMTVDATNVSLAANTATLTGVPTDTHRVLLVEPRDTSDASATRGVRFKPAAYNTPQFIRARSWSAIDPSSGLTVWYAISAAGSPVSAPTIYIAPQLSSALTLRFVYIPTLATLTATSNNPIPGESDKAIKAWIIAHANAKQRDDNSPDPNWLSIYSTEKQSVLTASTPRQEQEPRYINGAFDDDDYNEAW